MKVQIFMPIAVIRKINTVYALKICHTFKIVILMNFKVTPAYPIFMIFLLIKYKMRLYSLRCMLIYNNFVG